MTNHLAVYSRNRSHDYIEMILDGSKTLDIKLSTRQIAPYKKITAGDMLYIKESGGPVVGKVLIPKVEYYEISDPFQILEILEQIRNEVGLADEAQMLRMFEKVKFNKYVTVFHFTEPQRLKVPMKIHKSDRRVWIANYYLPQNLSLAFGIDPFRPVS